MKNFGIGVDIEEVARFSKIDRVRNKQFLQRIFTARELDYCFSKKDFAPHLAARFCVKEAVVKALASLEIHKVEYNSVEVIKTVKGVPQVHLRNKHKGLDIKISLSHTREYAVAFAVARMK